MLLQSGLRMIYPTQCTACGDGTDADHGLCAKCWSDTQFVTGTICDTCGAPLPGSDPSEIAHCDDCMKTARPWSKGRAVFVYSGVGRSLVLRLKHSDRTDIAPTAGLWLANVIRPLIKDDTVLVPVPLHWTRLIKRRYNQASLLADQAASQLGLDRCPDALLRVRATKPLDGHSSVERFEALEEVIKPNPKRAHVIESRPVILIDDVMTSGATLAACTKACFDAGAQEVCVATLARVVKDA